MAAQGQNRRASPLVKPDCSARRSGLTLLSTAPQFMDCMGVLAGQSALSGYTQIPSGRWLFVSAGALQGSPQQERHHVPLLL